LARKKTIFVKKAKRKGIKGEKKRKALGGTAVREIWGGFSNTKKKTGGQGFETAKIKGLRGDSTGRFLFAKRGLNSIEETGTVKGLKEKQP